MQTAWGPSARSAIRPPAPHIHAAPPKTLALLKALWSNPIEAWTERYFTEPVVLTKVMAWDLAVVSDPAAIRRVLVDNADNYRKDPLQKRMLSALANGLLAAEGGQWQFQRRVLAPLFTRRSVRDFVPGTLRAVDALVARWRCHAGEVIDVAAEARLLTLDVLERTIFSDGLGSDAEDIRNAMAVYFDRIGRIDPLDVLGVPAVVPRLGRWRAAPAFRLFDRAVDAMIAQRRRRLSADPAHAPHDMLTRLLTARDAESGRALSEAEVRANIITLIAAGHEASADALAWTLYLLSVSAEWRTLVVDEAERALRGADETTLDRLPIARAAVEEAMRLYPPLAAISRAAGAADTLAGAAIRPGTLIVIAPYVVHRHRRLWREPDVFDPARFLGRAREGIDRFAYLPFGGGPRGCIGTVFALQETVLAAAAIARNFDLAVAPGHKVWPVHRITLRPRGGLPMIVRRREPTTRRRGSLERVPMAVGAP